MVELAYSDERAEAFRAYMCLYGYKAAIDRCDWVAARLWKHIGKPLFTGQDVEDIIGVQRSDFDVVLADASYRRLVDLIEPEPERTCGEFEEA